MESEPMSLQTEWPSSSWTSAIRTFAPCRTKSLAVLSPMPLAPPVINATLPSNLQGQRNKETKIY